jgi:virginiamycin B lyase
LVLCPTIVGAQPAPAASPAPIALTACKVLTGVGQKLSGVAASVTFSVSDSRTADAVDFLISRDAGPPYEAAFHDVGSFAPGVTIRHNLQTPHGGDPPYGNSHCDVTAVHFTDGSSWHRPYAFDADERPTVVNAFNLAAGSGADAIAIAADGSPWIVEAKLNQIVHLDPGRGKTLATYAVPTAGAGIGSIALGAHDTVWFTESAAGKIGLIDAAGTVHEYPVTCGGCRPLSIARGADDRMWFAQTDHTSTIHPTAPDAIGAIAADGTVTQYPIPTPNSVTTRVAPQRDGTVWFAESSGKIGQLGADGKVIVELAATAEGPAVWLGLDAAGAVWVVHARTDGFGVGTLVHQADGTYTTTTRYVRAPFALPFGAAFDASGNIWVVDVTHDGLWRIHGDRFDLLVMGRDFDGRALLPVAVSAAPDGSLWVVENEGDAVVHLTPR